jgi:hypothetical protein
LATCTIFFPGLPEHYYKMFIYSMLFWQVIFKIVSLQGLKRYRFTLKFKIAFNDLFYLNGNHYTFKMYLHAWLAFWAVMRLVTCHFNISHIIQILLQSRVYTFRLLYFTLCWLFNLKQRFNRPDNGKFVPKSGRYYSFMFIYNL